MVTSYPTLILLSEVKQKANALEGRWVRSVGGNAIFRKQSTSFWCWAAYGTLGWTSSCTHVFPLSFEILAVPHQLIVNLVSHLLSHQLPLPSIIIQLVQNGVKRQTGCEPGRRNNQYRWYCVLLHLTQDNNICSVKSRSSYFVIFFPEIFSDFIMKIL